MAIKHTTDHLAAIKAGTVTKTNVIGLRKAINADERRQRGFSVGSTCPKWTSDEVSDMEMALEQYEPRVIGELHASGLTRLRSPRYRKRLESVRDIIDNLKSFHLVSFDRIGDHGMQAIPVYRARACNGKSFFFRNVPWQSGGNGPEVLGSIR